MKMQRRFVLLAAVAVSLAGLILVLVSQGRGSTTVAPLELGPDTTVLMSPLLEDGTVDYRTAVQNELGADVDPADNAYVVLVELIDPGAWRRQRHRQALFEALGVELPGEGASYFTSLSRYAAERAGEDPRWAERIAHDPNDPTVADLPAVQLRWDYGRSMARRGPWSPRDHPLVDQWLRTQEPALDRLAEGMQRPRAWGGYPAGRNSERLVTHIRAPTLPISHMVDALVIRAHRRIHAGDLDAAIDDVVAGLRVAQHLSDPLTAVEQLTGMEAAAFSFRVVPSLLSRPDLTREQLDRLVAHVDALPGRFPRQRPLDRLRFMMLEVLQEPDTVGRLLRRADAEQVLGPHVDRNDIMREVNAYFDRIRSAITASTRAERIRLATELDADIRRRINRMTELSRNRWWNRVLPVSEEEANRMVAARLTPNNEIVSEVVGLDRFATQHHLARVALALGAYQLDHGEYPSTLDALVPNYLPVRPVDIYDEEGGLLRYRLEPDRVILYSIGPRGEDAVPDGRQRDLLVVWSRAE